MYRTLACVLFSVVATIPLTGLSQSISVTEITPESPTRLDFGERVNISFEYVISDFEGVRIFVRPISNGKPAPNYSASGSPVYRTGKGEGSAFFTIKKGTATVDQLRFRVTTVDQDREIFEFFIPVEFSYSPSTPSPQLPTHQPPTPTPQPTINPPAPNIDVSERDTSDVPKFGYIPDSVSVEKRVIEKGGRIHIYYTGGYERVVEPSNYEYALTPEGDTLRPSIPMIDVQEASPPRFITTDSRANQEWITTLNKWLTYHNDRLLKRIDSMLDSDRSLQKYKTFEKNNSSTIYEEIDLRYRFLTELMGSRTR